MDLHKPVTLQDIGCPRRTHAGGAYRRQGMRAVAVNRFKHRVDKGGNTLTGKADADGLFRQTGGLPFADGSHVYDEKGITASHRPGAVGCQRPVSGTAQRQDEHKNDKGRTGNKAEPAPVMVSSGVAATSESVATHGAPGDQDTSSV